MPMEDLYAFLRPSDYVDAHPLETYDPGQLGRQILPWNAEEDMLENADILLLGCGEYRGDGKPNAVESVADKVREEFYTMFSWHPGIRVADLGDLRLGHQVSDSMAALKSILSEIHQRGKIALVIGGSHDMSTAQYQVFKDAGQLVHMACVDSLVDIDERETPDARSFLMDLFVSQPNFLKHYSHIGFQIYYHHPNLLDTLDRLRFDLFRLGRVREDLEEMEPVLRSADLLSFDMASLRFADAPYCPKNSPNGLSGEEACTLFRYAGMAPQLNSIGLYGVHPDHDALPLTARLMAQMIWYFIDGYSLRRKESDLSQLSDFYQFHLQIAEEDTLFLKSKSTNRWWMSLPGSSLVPCSYRDYQLASSGQIPERWFREQERLT